MWELDCEDHWALKNWCFWTLVLEKTLESLLDSKEIKPVNTKGKQSWIIHWKNRSSNWNSKTFATWWEELTPWKRPWFWERLKAGGEGDDREWDGWMVSLTLWTWIWASSRSWWWTMKPGMLHGPWCHRVEQKWLTELNWCSYIDRSLDYIYICVCVCVCVCIHTVFSLSVHSSTDTQIVFTFQLLWIMICEHGGALSI